MANKRNGFDIKSGHAGKDSDFSVINLEILTSGTTTVSDDLTNGSEYILAGRSQADLPTLQFIGVVGTPKTYMEHGFIVTNGAVEVGFQATVEVTSGLFASFGTFYLSQGVGSGFTLDGKSLIDYGGAVVDSAGGRPPGATFTLNGDVTVGPHGSNTLNLASVAGLTGSGTIRQTGQNDVTNVGNVIAGVHFDIRAGELTVGSSFGHFDGTIGPTNWSSPSLGPSAEMVFFPADFSPQQVQSAKFDTSAGLLSLIDAGGRDLVDFHFSGDASGLNVSLKPFPSVPVGTTALEIAITDHPGSVSPIPISFS